MLKVHKHNEIHLAKVFLKQGPLCMYDISDGIRTPLSPAVPSPQRLQAVRNGDGCVPDGQSTHPLPLTLANPVSPSHGSAAPEVAMETRVNLLERTGNSTVLVPRFSATNAARSNFKAESNMQTNEMIVLMKSVLSHS